jgi:hypothetical protein
MKIRSKHASAALAATVLALLPATAALAAPAFSITGPGGSVYNGATLTLSVNASDVADLFAYQFSIEFDPALFQAISVEKGDFLGPADAGFFDGGTIDNTAGSISLVFETLVGEVAGVTGSGLLNTIQFQVTGHSGVGSFSLLDVAALDSGINEFAVGTSSFTQVIAVPEPTSAWLLFGGVLALGGRRFLCGSRTCGL